jgi:hypothetical protein
LNAKGYGLAPALSIPPGFVKDPNSAWYINSTTGMYYDVNSKSYLHAATGKYYYLDVATNSLKEWASASVADSITGTPMNRSIFLASSFISSGILMNDIIMFWLIVYNKIIINKLH